MGLISSFISAFYIICLELIFSSAPETTTTKLSLPVMEPFGGRSTSPSPTAELMRGAGTTPILSNVPEGGFGDAVETAEEAAVPVTSAGEQPADFIWGSSGVSHISPVPTPTPTSNAPPMTSSADDIFGAAFEPPPAATTVPTAVVTPLSVQPQTETTNNAEKDLFGFDSSEFNDVGEQPLSAQPCAPPPSPFGGLDIGLGLASGPSQDLRAQAIANAVGVALPMPVQQKPVPVASGFEDLNFALNQTIQPTASPVLAASPTIPGLRPGFVGQPFPPMAAATGLPMGTAAPPPASASYNRLDNIAGTVGTPTGRASSTPGYGTPPSGMSSPAKSVASFGAPMPGDLSLHWPGLSVFLCHQHNFYLSNIY